MNKKFKILILLFFLLNHCGYSTVYKNNDQTDIKISLISMEGDKEFNNLLTAKLRRYYNSSSDNFFKISIQSNKRKNIVAKDSTGATSNYELIVETKFKIENDKLNQDILFIERLKIKNNDDSFEQRKYESVVLNNFASSMRDKLFLQLKTLK